LNVEDTCSENQTRRIKQWHHYRKWHYISFIAGLVPNTALIVIFIVEGNILAFDSNYFLRYFTYAVLIGVPLVYRTLVKITLIGKPTKMDERHRLIMERSSRTQWLAVIFSLAAWIISLTEIYREQDQAPIAFLSLIFISVLIISTLAQSLGILLGYWRMNRNG